MANKNQKIICPCCGNSQIKVLYKDLKDIGYFVEGKFNLLSCSVCRLEFLNPILTEKQLAKYYPEQEYYSFHNVNKLALSYHWLSAYFYSGKNFLANLFLLPLSPLFYRYYIDKGKKVLEIGCGDGLKLAIYKKYGMETFGLEPYGAKLTEEEKKLGIIRKSVGEVNYDSEFDYIVLKEVLEHVPDQKQILEKCYKWLKPGGKLIITVPNVEGIWRKIFKENWFGYDVPRHLYNYNPKNIKFYLKKFGFKINRIRIYDMPYMFDGSLKYRASSKTGEKEHRIIFSNFSKILATPASLIASYLGAGSLMEIECVK